MQRVPLPIDAVLPELVAALAGARAVVLEAPPGAGKTTRAPVALLDADSLVAGEIVVSEPRRLAARLSARRVAFERDEKVGETIGYSVRYEDVSSARTRVRYVTEGVLLRRLLADPELRGIGAIVLDEFHERQLATDLALALVSRLGRERRPDLKLVVMSATLDGAAIASYLGDCPRVRSEGRVYPVEIAHLPAPDERPLEKQVGSAVRQALAAEADGDVLVFLPGAGEIRKCQAALGALATEADVALLPLYGELPLEEQLRAVEPGPRRKVVLATNVAETSITIDGVTAVIDSGLARIADHSAWTGLPRLRIGKISRASATQRAGRAGRTRPGRVLRLYTRGDFESRRENDLPEIQRADLSETVLILHGAGLSPAEVNWLSPPDPSAVAAGTTLLEQLGALHAHTLTDVGRRMLDFPLHPRLARLMVEGERRGVANETALIAALLGERDIYNDAQKRAGALRDAETGPSDMLQRLEQLESARRSRFDPNSLRREGLDVGRVRAVDRAARQLERIAKRGAAPPGTDEELELTVGLCLLSAFSDRVAQRRRRGERELVLASGATARLSEHSVVHTASLLLAIDVEEQQAGGRSSGAIVRLASAIEPEWLLELCPDALGDTTELVWNESLERVERTTRLAIGSVVLDETRRPAEPSQEASQVLARAALGTAFKDRLEALDELILRLKFLRNAMPELALPELGEQARLDAVTRAAHGRTSLAELRELDLGHEYLASLTPEQQRAVNEAAPERLKLPGGRGVRVHYEPNQSPWIESRIQDFFGMRKTPTLARGRVPLTTHLLAPNQRAVQVTTDLEGFWERHYPAIRRELMRRYPRHAWPEDPLSAKPPEPKPRRT